MADLSPATVSGLKRFQELADTPPSQRDRIYTRLDPVYICPICGDEHEWEQEALDCCQGKDAEEADLRNKCPVCLTDHVDTHAAAHCCLWKDLTWLQRYLIANCVEAGTPWPEAIERFKDQNPIKKD
jgi:hypothetical protein